MAEWVEITVLASPDTAEDIAAELAERVEAAAAGAQLCDDGTIVIWAPAEQREQALRATRAAAAELGLGSDAVRSQPAAPEAEWRDAWKRYFRVSRVTRRLVIVPSWERFAPGPGDVVLDLDPGQAFGTGTHASTRLCLEELDQLDERGGAERRSIDRSFDRFFDLGTGSGILAIAAAKLWPGSTGLATDNDPTAVDCAADNCRRNGVDDRVRCELTPVESLSERFPLVLANIQAHVHLALRDAIAARVAPGGLLVLSGLLSEQAGAVAEAFASAGLSIERIRPSPQDPAWSAVRLRRPAS